jgi:hypothetical protein
MRVFDQFVRGWITAGEMIAACTRGGRMPILWMSVWLEGAFTRNACFLPDGNLREPWRAPVFHENTYIPPLAPGYAAAAFLAEAEKIQAALVGQASRLARGGQWMAEARAAGGRIWCVAVGHSYPVALEVPKEVSYPIEWGPSVSDLSQALPEDRGRGVVKIHFGYSPVDVGDVRKILDRGVKFIYSSPYGRPEQLKDHENLLWLDLPWRPADATVDIPGYSVRMLPMSSTAHTMAYFAILSEMAERMGWR